MTGTEEITNSTDILDSRDILERINYLEIGEEDLDEVDKDELETLRKLIEDIRDYGGDTPEDGFGLIRDSYFETYTEEFAGDIGAIDSNATWPLMHIDWDAAASDLKMDYTTVEFKGITYWFR